LLAFLFLLFLLLFIFCLFFASFSTSASSSFFDLFTFSRTVQAAVREKAVAQLFALVQGKAKQIIFAHDTVRIIQCLMAVKNRDIRNKLFDELKGDVLEIAKTKYGRFFVIKMLKYGTPFQRKYVIECFYKHIPELVHHTYASDVVEFAYSGYCSALQRYHMVSEFYGPRFSAFKGDKVESLNAVLEEQPMMKDHILKILKERLLEIVEALQDRVMEIIHTRDGVITAMNCIWFATPKQRKAVIRSMKTLVKKICLEEYGHMIMFAVFDSVDDTALVNHVIFKVLFSEMKTNIKEIAEDRYGIKVLLYLLSPRNKCYFISDTIALLSKGDGNPHSKKDQAERYRELLTYISAALITFAVDNVATLVHDVKLFTLLEEISQFAIGKANAVCKSLQPHRIHMYNRFLFLSAVCK
uniref:PUM-HD domain-containing protein n=1 Tax=Soboliphyme baturini TaxID=241478 RepID=A0A183IXQ9_9BILA